MRIKSNTINRVLRLRLRYNGRSVQNPTLDVT
jgi:hypothetical protein